MSRIALVSGVVGVCAATAIAVAVTNGVIDVPEWMGSESTGETRGTSAAPRVAATAEDTARPSEPSAPLVDAADISAAAATDAAEETKATEAEVRPPVFDLVRAEADGSTQVAGAGAPGAKLEVMVNGTLASETTIGSDGKFFVMLDLPDVTVGSVITLASVNAGSRVLSEDEVIIAPSGFTRDQTARPAPQPDIGAGALPPDTLLGPTAEAPAGTISAAAESTTPLSASVSPTGPSLGTTPTGTGLDAETRQTALVPDAETDVPAGLKPPSEGSPLALLPRTTEARSDAAQTANRNTASLSDTLPEADTETAPAILLATPRGVEVLQNAPLAPGQVALDSISYDAAGEVLLSGRGDQEAFVRVYLDNSPVTTSRIREDGRWRVELPDVDAGTYTLRVDQIDISGMVVARVESPFLRESPDTLEAVLSGEGPIRSVTVQPGNTLWAISKERYGEGIEYVKVFDANRDRIRNPDLIYPGQIFDLPD